MFCPVCGSRNPDGSRFCSTCGATLAPSAAPQPAATAIPPPAPAAAAVPPMAGEAAVAGSRIAGLGDRLIAVIIDTLVFAAIFAVVGMWAATRWGGLTESGFQLDGKAAIVAMGATAVIGFIYYWLLEALAGATIGKGIAGIRVCDAQGRRCGLGASLIRNLVRIIDGLAVYLVGFLVALFSKNRQRLGDHLAHTYVVHRVTGTAARAVLVGLWFVLLAGGVLGAILLHRQAGAPAGSEQAWAAAETAEATSRTEGSAPRVIASGDLKLENFRFTEREDGPARASANYRRGDHVRAEWQLTGYSTDAQGQIHLKYSVAITDPDGLSVYSGSQEEHGAPKTVKPISMHFSLDIPVFAPAGVYGVRVDVHDDVKNTDGRLTAGFVVQGEPLPASKQLEIRDLALSASEGGAPLDPAVVSPGSTVYMSGNVAGIQFREDAIDFQLAFQVFGPDGEKLFDRPDFLTFSDTISYRPKTFFVPISGHLNLPSDLPKGKYTERYILTDRIGGASRTYELHFEVR